MSFGKDTVVVCLVHRIVAVQLEFSTILTLGKLKQAHST